MYKEYYFLQERKAGTINPPRLPKNFNTFESAFAKMCELYQTKKIIYDVMITTISSWDGHENSMTQRA